MSKTDARVDISPPDTTLTSAYSGWATEWSGVGDANHIRIALTITKADATSIELTMEVADEDEGTVYEVWTRDIDAGPPRVERLQQKVFQIQATDLGSTSRVTFRYNAIGYQRFRFLAKKTGGSGTVTMSLEYMVQDTG